VVLAAGAMAGSVALPLAAQAASRDCTFKDSRARWSISLGPLRYDRPSQAIQAEVFDKFNEETMADVRAEMTANVWQVPAVVGQVVAEGDVLVILESMKMEIPVEAPKAGTVTEVRVKPEDTVQENDILVVIS
jgi:acetyl-CoA carboxylase biotin carboxyl carrier protein